MKIKLGYLNTYGTETNEDEVILRVYVCVYVKLAPVALEMRISKVQVW